MHAPLAPSSESTRPQYGSSPLSEHCTSWLLRDAARGEPGVGVGCGPATSIRARTSSRLRRRAPSARRATPHTSVSASVNACASRPAPAPRRWRARAPCRSCECTRRRSGSRTSRRPPSRARAAAPRVDRGIGGDDGEHRRHRRRQHRRALRHPADRRRRRRSRPPPSARCRWSGSPAPRRRHRPSRRCAHSFGMPVSSGAIGIGMPMRPVEHTSTSVGVDTRGPSRGQLAHAPRVGAARLAGRGVGVAGAEHDRGGAAVGEVRAADLHRRRLREIRGEHARGRAPARRSSVATIARSGAPDSLIPHASPPASNPLAAVTLTAHHCRSPDSGRPVVSGRPSSEVRGLDRLARRALHEVVDRPRSRARSRCGRRSAR